MSQKNKEQTELKSKQWGRKIRRQIVQLKQAQIQQQASLSEQHFLRQFQDIVNIQLESTRYNCVMDDKDIFEDANNKINQLIAVCVTSKQEQIENKPQQQIKESSCTLTKHLLEIFPKNKGETRLQRINRLKVIRAELYSQIEAELSKEESLMNQKLLGRIKRQARLAAKQSTIRSILKCIEQKQKWQSQNKHKIKQECLKKQVEEAALSNLRLMQFIMEKKINTNDRIYESYGDSQSSGLDSYLAKFEETLNQLKPKLDQGLKVLRFATVSCQVEQSLTRAVHKGSKSIELNSQQILMWFQQNSRTLSSLQANEVHDKLLQRCQTIEKALR